MSLPYMTCRHITDKVRLNLLPFHVIPFCMFSSSNFMEKFNITGTDPVLLMCPRQLNQACLEVSKVTSPLPACGTPQQLLKED